MAAILLEIEAEGAEVENRHRPIPRVHRNRATPLDRPALLADKFMGNID